MDRLESTEDLETRLLRRTFELARHAKNRGNGPYGALLAKGARIVEEAENTVGEDDGDVTCHAELNVLRKASRVYASWAMAEFTLYASTEPCAMCAGAAYFAGIGRIVYGASSKAVKELRGEGLALDCRTVFEAGSRASVEVVGPLLEEEAMKLH